MKQNTLSNGIIFGSTGALGSRISLDLAQMNTNLILHGKSFEKLIKLDNEIKAELEPIHESKQEATSTNDLETGVSLDNAAYLENNINQEHTHKDEVQEEVVIDDISIYEEKAAENLETNSNEVPQLFSDEVNPSTSSEDNLSENLKNEEEEFEIPAFLRKQKF